MNLKSAACIAANPLKEREFTKAFQVMSNNREFDKKVQEVSHKRNDALFVSVKGRIRFITDLHAAGPVYHMPAIHLLEQVKIWLKSTVKMRVFHHQA